MFPLLTFQTFIPPLFLYYVTSGMFFLHVCRRISFVKCSVIRLGKYKIKFPVGPEEGSRLRMRIQYIELRVISPDLENQCSCIKMKFQ